MKPLCIDLFCGLGGWAEGFLAEGWDVIGFDIERRDYGTGGYPAQLVLQDVLTLHGAQFRDVDCIVASPPCQRYSYMAMPWSRAKAQAAEIRADLGKLIELNRLFWACFDLQAQASRAAGRHIPMVVEDVKGAQPWVGRAAWHYGSYCLWGDVPALMPITLNTLKRPGRNFHAIEHGLSSPLFNGAEHETRRDGFDHTRHLTNQRESDGVKQHGSGPEWFDTGISAHSSNSDSRKAASAMIAKIPFELARHIAQVYKPDVAARRVA